MDNVNLNTSGGDAAPAFDTPQVHTSNVDHAAFMAAPITKLDADQYIAEDLDGVTESIFGSGNLNFLLMQSGQTNEMMQMTDAFSITGEAPDGLGALLSNVSFASLSSSSNEFGFKVANFLPNNDRPIANDDNGLLSDNSPGSNGSFTNSAVASMGASGFALTANQPISTLNGSDGLNGDAGDSGVQGRDGINGSDGSGTNIVNVENITINLGDITNITEIIDIVDEVLDNGLTLQLDTVLGNLSDLNLDLITGDTVTNLVNQGVDLSPATSLLDPVLGGGNLVIGDLHSVISILDGENDHRPGDADAGLGVDLGFGDIPLFDNIFDIALNPVEDVLGDFDVVGNIGLNPFHVDNSANDTDLTLNTGLGLVDNALLDPGLGLNLNPLENIIGDIDFDLGAGINLMGNVADNIVDHLPGGAGDENLLAQTGDMFGDNLIPANEMIENLLSDLTGGEGNDTDLGLDIAGNDLSTGIADGLLNPVEDVTGDLDIGGGVDLGLLAPDNSADDVDLHLETDLDLINNDLLDLPLDLNLDAVENIIGDIDFNPDLSVNALGDVADGLVDDFAGGAGQDTPLSQIGDSLSDLGAPAVDSVMDNLPDDILDDTLDGLLAETGSVDNILPDIQDLGSAPFDLFSDGADNPADIDFADLEVPDLDFLDMPIDPVTDFINDLGDDIDAALDLLNPVIGDSGIGELLGGSSDDDDGLLAWPESILPDAGDIVGAVAGDTLGDILPAPVGDIAEGLGGLGNILGGGGNQGGGGLFGGGLFG